MLLFPVARFRKRRGKTRRVPPAPPAPLTLVSATYDEAVPSVTLTFDRPVDITGFVGSAVIVDDATFTGLRYDGTGGAALGGAATVVVTLISIADPTGVAVTLDASAGNGIVAADDGGPWEGVSDLSLPFA